MAALLAIDHLVVAARTLGDGSQAVARMLGVDLDGGGKHPLMGTHNRLVRLGANAYLEVIAIDPDVPQPPRPRWFALDDPIMQLRVSRAPTLVAWVARVDDIDACVRVIPEAGEIQAMRRGNYTWSITVRSDGALAFNGVLPSFIAWDGDAHPADALPDRGLRLLRLAATHPRSADVRARLKSVDGLNLIELRRGEPSLRATISTPGYGTISLDTVLDDHR